MNTDKKYSFAAQLDGKESPEMVAIVNEVRTIADRSADDVLALLKLLRTLEQLHHDIQADYFQAALPDSRQSLYALLRDIEENGGWPYIQRFKLQSLCAYLLESDPAEED